MSGIKQKMEDFNKRWNVASTQSYANEFKIFKTRILNTLQDVDANIPDEGITKFCNLVGITAKWKFTVQTQYSTNIFDTFMLEENEKEFYRLIEYLFLLPFNFPSSFNDDFDSYRENYYLLIKEVIDYSKVNVRILKNGDDILLCPKGEDLLDEELVNEVMTFLNQQSNNHLIEALKFYENLNGVKSAESLRRSLEEFLRYKLNNIKGLKNNISELQRRMKEDNRKPQIRNIITQVFKYLDQYFNENSKHQDGEIDEAENEYLIYQVGVLMRYINKVI